jgi:cell division protein ZapD
MFKNAAQYAFISCVPPYKAVSIFYEHPLNERIRTLMRLENTFTRLRVFSQRKTAADHQVAMQTLFELLDIAARADMKSDLLQELERQKLVLNGWRERPDVDQKQLANLLADIDHTITDALAQTGKAGAAMRENEWLMSIKQRMSLPGGVCGFDLPALHYWLSRSNDERQANLDTWFQPFQPFQDGVNIILKLLRGSGQTSRHVAQKGLFQLMQSATKTSPQLLRVAPCEDVPCVPEISANKYAISVRFISVDNVARGKPYDGDLSFDLTLFSL